MLRDPHACPPRFKLETVNQSCCFPRKRCQSHLPPPHPPPTSTSQSPPLSLPAAQVVVRVQGVDMARGYACGVMEAMNVPQANEPIITFWEGEIIDNTNHSFFTQGWGAGR